MTNSAASRMTLRGRRAANLDESIEELRDIADSRNDVLTRAAGITAGSSARLAFDFSIGLS